MKKKIVTVLLTAALGSSMLAGQAVMAAETTIKTTETTTATETADAEKVTEEKTIGVKPEKDTEGVFSMKLKNLTGKAITEVTVKNEKDEKYPDNFLEKDDKFAADEERTLWFDPNASKEAEETADAADAKETDSKTSEETEIPKYDMQITFEDATTAVLHTLPFGDTEEAELHLEGEIAYLVFDSTSLKKSINTKETEQALAPKPTEAPVQQSSSQTQDYSYNESYDYDYSYDYDDSYDGSYDNDDYDDSGASDDGGSDGGCLDDALLN